MNHFRLRGRFQARPRFSNKLPALYLDHLCDPADAHHLDIYLVNNSGRTLTWVASPQPLLLKSSRAAAPIERDTLRYAQVLSGEAVKVAEFDEVFDSDFLHRLQLQWQYPEEAVRCADIIDKGIGKFCYRVLEWLDHA